MEKNYRIQFTTSDGVLVMNRSTDKSLWRHMGTWLPDKTIRQLLTFDCREKGVRLVSYKMHETHLEGIVEWL